MILAFGRVHYREPRRSHLQTTCPSANAGQLQCLVPHSSELSTSQDRLHRGNHRPRTKTTMCSKTEHSAREANRGEDMHVKEQSNSEIWLLRRRYRRFGTRHFPSSRVGAPCFDSSNCQQSGPGSLCMGSQHRGQQRYFWIVRSVQGPRMHRCFFSLFWSPSDSPLPVVIYCLGSGNSEYNPSPDNFRCSRTPYTVNKDPYYNKSDVGQAAPPGDEQCARALSLDLHFAHEARG